MRSLLRMLTTPNTLLDNKAAVFIKAGCQIKKLTKESRERSEEEGGSRTEIATFLAKIAYLAEGIAHVVQVCVGGVELVQKTTPAVD